MTRYSVYITSGAERQFTKLPHPAQRRLLGPLLKLEENPRPRGVQKLSGSQNLHRIAVGEYRVIYQIRDEVLWVLVVRIRPRRDVYRGALHIEVDDSRVVPLSELLERLAFDDA